jgi:hypothetical protein
MSESLLYLWLLLLPIFLNNVHAWTNSIQLSYQTPPKVTAFQVQVTVLEGMDPDKTYWVAAGFDGGYFGIQTKSKTERWINYSVWNKAGAAKLEKKGPGVIAQNFNHEGSGVQTHRSYFWQTGVPQSFMVTAKPGQSGSAVFSGYFLIDGKWELIASIERSGASPYLTGLHSFLENFGSEASMMRQGRYSNTFYQEEGKPEWKLATQASTSNRQSRNAPPSNAVDSWNHSVDDKGFLMEMYGKTKTRNTRSTSDISTSAPTLVFKGNAGKPLPLPGNEGAGGIHIPDGNHKENSGPSLNRREILEDSNSKGSAKLNLNEGQGKKVNLEISGNTKGIDGIQTGTRQPNSDSGLKDGYSLDSNKHNAYGDNGKRPNVDSTWKNSIASTKQNDSVQTGSRQPDSRSDIKDGRNADPTKHNVYADSGKLPNVDSTSKNIYSTETNNQKDPVGGTGNGIGKKKKTKKKKRTKNKGKKCRVYKKHGLFSS